MYNLQLLATLWETEKELGIHSAQTTSYRKYIVVYNVTYRVIIAMLWENEEVCSTQTKNWLLVYVIVLCSSIEDTLLPQILLIATYVNLRSACIIIVSHRHCTCVKIKIMMKLPHYNYMTIILLELIACSVWTANETIIIKRLYCTKQIRGIILYHHTCLH